jgi:hypothetical protein
VVLLLVLFLSLFTVLLSPMTLLHHQSILHYGDSITLEKLADAAKEQALAFLESTWVSSYDTGWIPWDDELSYKYVVSPISDSQRTLHVWVKKREVERHFQGVVTSGTKPTSLEAMTSYGLYTNQVLQLSEISTMTAIPTMVALAAEKDVFIYGGSLLEGLKINVHGNIYIKSFCWEKFHKSVVLDRSILPQYDIESFQEFIYLLKNVYGDRMNLEGFKYALSLNLDELDDTTDLVVVEQVDQLNIRGTFSGLLVMYGCPQVVVRDVELAGMMVFAGSPDIQMDNTRIQGVLGLVDSPTQEPLDLALQYDPQVLSGIWKYITLENPVGTRQRQLYVEEFTEIP